MISKKWTMDYEFSRLLIGKSEVQTVDATRIYHTIDKATRKAERKTSRNFDFSDTDTSESSSEGSETENGSRASSREVFRGAKLERFVNRVTKRLQLLLVSEPQILLNSIMKRKKFIRELLQDARVNVAQALPIIRRRPVQGSGQLNLGVRINR